MSTATPIPASPTFADRAISYYLNLQEPETLPVGVSALNPYQSPPVQAVVQTFYQKFFNDHRPRVFVMGINPGRFGAGVTGISFTTAQNLRTYCGIENPLPNTPELSSRFVYRVVEALGGADAFYGRFFLTSLYPLALMKDSKNYNFYDDRVTTATLWPVITDMVRQQLAFGYDRAGGYLPGPEKRRFSQTTQRRAGLFRSDCCARPSALYLAVPEPRPGSLRRSVRPHAGRLAGLRLSFEFVICGLSF